MTKNLSEIVEREIEINSDNLPKIIRDIIYLNSRFFRAQSNSDEIKQLCESAAEKYLITKAISFEEAAMIIESKKTSLYSLIELQTKFEYESCWRSSWNKDTYDAINRETDRNFEREKKNLAHAISSVLSNPLKEIMKRKYLNGIHYPPDVELERFGKFWIRWNFEFVNHENRYYAHGRLFDGKSRWDFLSSNRIHAEELYKSLYAQKKD